MKKNNIITKMKIKNKFIILSIILLLTLVISLLCGSSKMNIIDCIIGLFTNKNITFSIIMRNVRLPRIIASILAGIGLSVSGLIIQSITDNSLASPNIIGVNSGAGLFVILLLFLLPNMYYLTPFASFIGAFLTTLIIIIISQKINNNKSTIILTGVAITSLFNGIISLITLLDNDVLSTYKYFSIGGLSGVTYDLLYIPLLLAVLSIIIVYIFVSKIEILSLGDELAKSLGVNIKFIKFIALICASCLASSVVSFAGLLGFVGLVVPHISRKIINGNLKQNLIGSILLGAIVMLIADTIGRCLFLPTELPVGIVMSFIGGPFFLYLLLRRKTYVED